MTGDYPPGCTSGDVNRAMDGEANLTSYEVHAQITLTVEASDEQDARDAARRLLRAIPDCADVDIDGVESAGDGSLNTMGDMQ